ncbi:MAG: hypothetical protein ACUVR6_05540 [Anaerolineae bacterium]
MQRPLVVIQGGARRIPEEEHEPHIEGCRRAAIAGWEVLRASGSALDAAPRGHPRKMTTRRRA